MKPFTHGQDLSIILSDRRIVHLKEVMPLRIDGKMCRVLIRPGIELAIPSDNHSYYIRRIPATDLNNRIADLLRD